jgi:long-chain fatty acid transport protein
MACLPGLAGASASPLGAIPGLPIAGFAAGGAGLTSFYVIGFELGPWQEYLAQELTPDYMLAEDAQPVYVSWIGSGEVFLLPDFAAKLEAAPETWIKLNFEWQTSAEYDWPANGAVNGPGNGTDPVYEGSSFERQYFAPGLERSLGEGGVLGVAAVIAYQRYSAANLGMFAASTPDLGPVPGYGSGYGLSQTPYSGYEPFQESGFGTGVRLAVRQEVISGVALDAGFQSRIDMEEFAAYRGVYSQPADLDIPARARLGLAFQASERSWLNVAVERVLYSDISAFPSRYLPNRFLSMLGDSTSPSFNWEDLTVYTVGFAWSDGRMQEWHIDLSTRTQPSPSSRLLSQALAGDLSDGAMVVGYSRRTGDRSRLAFNAAYAPSEYAFGGSVLGVTTDELDRQFEVEANWTLSF